MSDRIMRERRAELDHLREVVALHNEAIRAAAPTSPLVAALRESAKQQEAACLGHPRAVLMREAADALERLQAPASADRSHNSKLPSLPEEIQEWCWHMDTHLTEHDIRHAGLALRAAWPHVREWLMKNVSPSSQSGVPFNAAASAKRDTILTYTDEELCEMHRAVLELAHAMGNPAVSADGDKTIESETIRLAAERLARSDRPAD